MKDLLYAQCNMEGTVSDVLWGARRTTELGLYMHMTGYKQTRINLCHSALRIYDLPGGTDFVAVQRIKVMWVH